MSQSNLKFLVVDDFATMRRIIRIIATGNIFAVFNAAFVLVIIIERGEGARRSRSRSRAMRPSPSPPASAIRW